MSTLIAEQETHESSTLFQRAQEMMVRANYEGAALLLKESLAISPKNATYLSSYGLCIAVINDDYSTAITMCESAVRLDPKNPKHRVNLGKIYKLQGQTSEAYESFIRAWKTDKSHPSAASELQRMGIRRPPVLTFLSRSNWLNIHLGRLRAKLERGGQSDV